MNNILNGKMLLLSNWCKCYFTLITELLALKIKGLNTREQHALGSIVWTILN